PLGLAAYNTYIANLTKKIMDALRPLVLTQTFHPLWTPVSPSYTTLHQVVSLAAKLAMQTHTSPHSVFAVRAPAAPGAVYKKETMIPFQRIEVVDPKYASTSQFSPLDLTRRIEEVRRHQKDN